MSIFRKNRQTYVSNPIAPAVPKSNAYIGVTIPFNNPNGIFYQSTLNRDQLFSNLRNLLMTAKGERYFLPEFGTEIRYILFENITDEDVFIEKIKDNIISAINEWMPFITIEELTVKINVAEDGRVDDPSHAIGIKLLVKVDRSNIYLPIQIFISTTGRMQIEAIYNGTS